MKSQSSYTLWASLLSSSSSKIRVWYVGGREERGEGGMGKLFCLSQLNKTWQMQTRQDMTWHQFIILFLFQKPKPADSISSLSNIGKFKPGNNDSCLGALGGVVILS